jgi:hypothetical protein
MRKVSLSSAYISLLLALLDENEPSGSTQAAHIDFPLTEPHDLPDAQDDGCLDCGTTTPEISVIFEGPDKGFWAWLDDWFRRGVDESSLQ